jgi:hypothetical protein
MNAAIKISTKINDIKDGIAVALSKANITLDKDKEATISV